MISAVRLCLSFFENHFKLAEEDFKRFDRPGVESELNNDVAYKSQLPTLQYGVQGMERSFQQQSSLGRQWKLEDKPHKWQARR